MLIWLGSFGAAEKYGDGDGKDIFNIRGRKATQPPVIRKCDGHGANKVHPESVHSHLTAFFLKSILFKQVSRLTKSKISILSTFATSDSLLRTAVKPCPPRQPHPKTIFRRPQTTDHSFFHNPAGLTMGGNTRFCPMADNLRLVKLEKACRR